MPLKELGNILNKMYSTAPEGEKVAHIHLFAIKYANIILSNHYSTKDILEYAELNKSYVTELSKGIKLSKYVTVK